MTKIKDEVEAWERNRNNKNSKINWQFTTTYKLYYKLNKEIEDDPKVSKKKGSSAATRFVSLHPHNLAQKTQVIIEHFRRVVTKKIGGKAKAMVVTSSRLHAVRYKQAY